MKQAQTHSETCHSRNQLAKLYNLFKRMFDCSIRVYWHSSIIKNDRHCALSVPTLAMPLNKLIIINGGEYCDIQVLPIPTSSYPFSCRIVSTKLNRYLFCLSLTVLYSATSICTLVNAVVLLCIELYLFNHNTFIDKRLHDRF